MASRSISSVAVEIGSSTARAASYTTPTLGSRRDSAARFVPRFNEAEYQDDLDSLILSATVTLGHVRMQTGTTAGGQLPE
ncbi:hypothetical protein E5D57_003101 [Metarhizium anisopliae]|nr:hypothetical protein E5D57_003101 [Metarhizium anisopliae]